MLNMQKSTGSGSSKEAQVQRRRLLQTVSSIVQEGAQAKELLAGVMTRKLARMLRGAKGVPAGEEPKAAQRIVKAHFIICHVFPWTWAGQAITSKAFLEGIEEGELLTWEESGLQVGGNMSHMSGMSGISSQT